MGSRYSRIRHPEARPARTWRRPIAPRPRNATQLLLEEDAETHSPDTEPDEVGFGIETEESTALEDEPEGTVGWADDDEEPVQLKAEGPAPRGPGTIEATGPGRALGATTRRRMESAFRFDFSRVRIFDDRRADASLRASGAIAATRGDHVFARAGTPLEGRPDVLAHELAHVVHQTGDGPAGGATRAALEVEADDAARAVRAGDEVEVTPGAATGLREPLFKKPPRKRRKGKARKRTKRRARRTKRAARRKVRKKRGPCGRRSRRVKSAWIKHIDVELRPRRKAKVTLTWAGKRAAAAPLKSYYVTPGAGCCKLDCNDRKTSRTTHSQCTPKGTFTIRGKACKMTKFPKARNVLWFQRSGIALHSWPSRPNYPASHGCLRQPPRASEVIYDNIRTSRTTVKVHGTFRRRKRGKCYNLKACRKAYRALGIKLRTKKRRGRKRRRKR